MIVLRVRWNHNYHWRPHSTRRERRNWQAQREALFQEYTLASLQRQNYQDWQVWLWCDPDLRPLTTGMERRCNDERVRLVYGLGNACRTAALETPVDEPLIFGRLDSDDVLHPEALACWAAEKDPGLVQFGDGYAWEIKTGRLFEWNHFSSPFIAQIDARDVMRYQAPELGGNHGQVYKIARRLNERRYYLVTLHGDNVCNTVDSRWVGNELMGSARQDVLTDFGLEAAAYVSGPDPIEEA